MKEGTDGGQAAEVQEQHPQGQADEQAKRQEEEAIMNWLHLMRRNSEAPLSELHRRQVAWGGVLPDVVAPMHVVAQAALQLPKGAEPVPADEFRLQ